MMEVVTEAETAAAAVLPRQPVYRFLRSSSGKRARVAAIWQAAWPARGQRAAAGQRASPVGAGLAALTLALASKAPRALCLSFVP